MDKITNKKTLMSLLNEIGEKHAFVFEKGYVFKASLLDSECFIFSKENKNVLDIFSDGVKAVSLDDLKKHGDFTLFEVCESKYKAYELNHKGDIFYVLGDFKRNHFNSYVKMKHIGISKKSSCFLDVMPDLEMGTVVGFDGENVKTVSTLKSYDYLFELHFLIQDVKIQGEKLTA